MSDHTPFRPNGLTGPYLDDLYDGEAEQIVLGAILRDDKQYRRFAEMGVWPERFGNKLHCRIFAQLEQCIKTGGVDLTTLSEALDQDCTLAGVGGKRYLLHLVAAAADAIDPAAHAEKVVDLAVRRGIVAISDGAIKGARLTDLHRPAGVLIEEVQTQLAEIKRRPGGTCEPDREYILQKLPLSTWIHRDIPTPDFIFGEVMSSTSRLLLIAPTGLGKTNFLLALATPLATGAAAFLHWKIPKARRVIYVDGEMSDRLMKKRALDAVRRNGGASDQLFILNREDFPDMPPLNTEAGQEFIDHVIDSVGGVDLVIFDNIQALLSADDSFGAKSWEETLPWIRDLTRRKVGQIWVHHTGLDESHGYGTKTREWQLDTVALLEQIERPEADIAFMLKFTKCRERTPDNRTDFDPAVITLTGDTWVSEKGNFSPKRNRTELALDVLNDEIARGNGTIPPPNKRIPPNTMCITTIAWRAAYKLRTLDASDDAAERSFYRAAKDLTEKRKSVAKHDRWVWPVR